MVDFSILCASYFCCYRLVVPLVHPCQITISGAGPLTANFRARLRLCVCVCLFVCVPGPLCWYPDVVLCILLLNSHYIDTLTLVFPTEEGLIVTCQDLFVAGEATTSSTLAFCLLYMVLHPHVQNSIQKELDIIVGRNRRPSVADKHRFVSTRA